VVGHLSHLLPIRDAVVLRCHPVELLARLRTARRGSASDRRENVVAETTDVVLLEALRRRRRVWEVDTTGRSVADVAREVDAIVRDRAGPHHGSVDWLADPLVTDYLLPALR
jgi:adenylate kinase